MHSVPLPSAAFFRPFPLLLSLALTACGGGGSESTGGAPSTPVAPLSPLSIAGLETAQTHVLPETGLSWSLSNATESLHLTGQRDTLVLLDLGQANPAHPILEAWHNGTLLGQVAILPPDDLPPTEAAGAAYSTTRYSATLPAAWIMPGLTLRVSADNYLASAFHTLKIGLNADFDLWTLPFYLFGANDSNAPPLSVTAQPDATTQQELYAKWPVAQLNIRNHPAQRVDWPYIVVGPRSGGAAYRVTNKDEQKDGYAVMSATLGVLGAIRSANGDAATANQYYAPLLMLNQSGAYSHPGGGLGGGSLGTGDYSYAGIFIHEQGHAFGMPHAGEAYSNGSYPYASGSLLGSVWGYDAGRREFLAPFLPSTASTFNNCQSSTSRVKDSAGRCIKQDPMQGGSGDQATGDKFTLFSDFNAAVIQRYFEGRTTDNAGVHSYSGGRIFVDAASVTGYSRWDSISQQRVAVTPITLDKGLYGLDMALPQTRDTKVHTIVVSYSLAGTEGASQIYPTLSYTGNLRRLMDPANATDRTEIVPNTGTYPWYCHASGCDYTLRVTYSDDSQKQVLLQGGFRSWFKPMDSIPASAYDVLSGSSFKVWAVNVPGDKAIGRIELLDTPMAWNGVPANPTVLLSR